MTAPNPLTLFDSQIERMFHASRYASGMLLREPTLREALRLAGGAPFSTADMTRALAADDTSVSALHQRLRALRQHVMVHLIFRDINRLADLAEILSTVSALAEVSVTAALDFHASAAAKALHLPASWRTEARAQLVVVGMGKLGAAELNVSSDIDLIFVYAEDGDATGEKSWREFHTQVGKGLIRALDAVDENGFVFRVDMRLRPFGDAGPLVTSLASLDEYFRLHARPWERYAWLKAHAITGEAGTVAALTALVTPFVFRRYHDFGAINEMRELFAQIRAEAIKRNQLDNIKVGVGGIRQIEFVAQLHQLIRGGRDSALQTRSTREALKEIGARQLITPSRVAALQTAYVFLRELEHRLQYLDDTQTQSLPTSEEDRARIAVAMGFANWALFLVALDRHRDCVRGEFDALFLSESLTAKSPAANPETSLETTIHALFGAPPDATHERILQRVRQWQGAARTATLSPKTRARIETLLVAATGCALKFPGQEIAVALALFDLFDAVDRRETYLALLTEYPDALARAARIAAKSPWAAEFLKRHPILLDELIGATATSGAINWPQEITQLQAACDHASGDIERQYELLRHTKQLLTLRLNIADIDEQIDVMTLSDELSRLADLLLNTTLVLAARVAGIACIGWNPPAGFAIVGYGKLGSKELGYASDLDLVFLYDQASAIPADRYARLAQRLSSWLNTTTTGGQLYDTDLRLRPDGAAGLLVSSLTAFREYQLTRAWTWEHQALTRARWCAGDAALAAPFEAIRREVLTQSRDSQKLKAEIVAMREKMRAEKKDRGDMLDLKHTLGGMVDVEFIVQYIILAHAHDHAEFLGNLGNFALLDRAGALGLLDPTLAHRVGDAYLRFREQQHLARTHNQAITLVPPTTLSAERAAVGAAWQALLGH